MTKVLKPVWDLFINVLGNYVYSFLLVTGLSAGIANFFNPDRRLALLALLALVFFAWGLSERLRRRKVESYHEERLRKEMEAKRKQGFAIALEAQDRHFRASLARKRKRDAWPQEKRFLLPPD